MKEENLNDFNFLLKKTLEKINKRTSKFKFQINAGALYRAQVRRELNRSKEKLEYMYTGSSVTIREEKYLLNSTFYVQGVDFPDTDEFEAQIRNWERKIKLACN